MLLRFSYLHEVIEAEGVFASAGSACHSHSEEDKGGDASKVKVSHVLSAMRVPSEFALGTLRLSVGRGTTQEELLHAANAIHKAIHKLI